MQEDTLPCYIGYDAREHEAFQVCRHSLIRHSSWPLCAVEMREPMLRYIGMYDRAFTEQDGQRIDAIDGKPFSTEFSFTRFLVPALAQYRGWALFMDCDMLVRADLRELLALRDDKYAAMVVKHVHVPSETEKMEGQEQTRYFRKNWSSFVLWNCGHPSNMNLTVDAVNREPGGWLHAFSWLKDDEIGALPERWNWLEGWSPAPGAPWLPANVHFTRGGPWLEEYQGVAYADEWRRERALIENGEPTKVRRDALAFTGGK